jgi:hypothetical protein
MVSVGTFCSVHQGIEAHRVREARGSPLSCLKVPQPRNYCKAGRPLDLLPLKRGSICRRPNRPFSFQFMRRMPRVAERE